MNENVSLVIPAYNASKTIEPVINSALCQSYNFNEIIVVDDCSKDNTKDIISNFNNIFLIKNYENQGLSKSRNIGIKKSKNEIFACIDADVQLDKFWLEKLIKVLKNNEVALCGGKLIEKYIHNSCNKWRSIRYKQNWGEENILNPPFIFGCNFVNYKKSWSEVNGFDEKLRTNGEDIDFSKKIRKLGLNTSYCSEAICHHLQNDNIPSLSKRVWRYHSFGYKIQKVSVYRMIRLTLKQVNFLFKRTFEDIFKLRINFININIAIFIYFIYLEFQRIIKKK
tara:strand:- start:126 stop:968 length:843 start_codon:yes stop_codon:yes gene_type:complete